MTSKYIEIRMVVKYSVYNARIVSHNFVQFYLLLLPFNIYYVIELDLILS